MHVKSVEAQSSRWYGVKGLENGVLEMAFCSPSFCSCPRPRCHSRHLSSPQQRRAVCGHEFLAYVIFIESWVLGVTKDWPYKGAVVEVLILHVDMV
ncbi:hypothetical protein TNCV_202061 [Trichonephila clavipes]|nr:hypothetical protein TNCV_202061 [Trichonephila clavipes]